MNLDTIFDSATIVRPPPGSFGGEVRVANRDAMLATLARLQRVQSLGIGALFVIVVLVILVSLSAAISCAAAINKSYLPFLGGGALLALLEYARRLVIMYGQTATLRAMLEGASDEQLAAYIEFNLTMGRKKAVRRAATKPVKKTDA